MDQVGRHLQQHGPAGRAMPALLEVPAPAGDRKLAVPRIVAYGDSLTAGFPGLDEPYARALSEALAESGTPVEISVCGMCGLTAEQMLVGANEYMLRDNVFRQGVGLLELVRGRRGAWRSADLVLIMAGTNDLANPAVTGEQIARYVRQLHAICHAAGVRTVALSIPDAGIHKYKQQRHFTSRAPPSDAFRDKELQREFILAQRHHETELSKVARRRSANAILAQWARSRSSDCIDTAPPVDVPPAAEPPSLEAYLKALDMEEDHEGTDGKLPSLDAYLQKFGQEEKMEQKLDLPEMYVNMGSLLPHGPQARAARCWETDRVHFTRTGSRLLGKRLAAVLQPLVAKLASMTLLDRGGEGSADNPNEGAPSLEAFLEAFRLEDELAEAGGPEVGKGPLRLEEPAGPHEWEEEAAMKLQQFFRSKRRQ